MADKKTFADEFVVKPDTKVRLDDYDPDYTWKFKDRKAAQGELDKSTCRLGELQYLLYAEGKRAVLVVLQAMDAGGKDGTIKHVMGPLNPQSCKVTSFKAPNAEELAHDFLWRIHKAVPGRGEIGIFNRSHYEDVLIVRVHDLAPKPVWSKRFDQINDFERILVENDVHVLKFFLHISKDEQLQRFRDRLAEKDKHWKIDPADFSERQRWDEYVKAYEDAISRCSTRHAPWYIIPANHKWFRNLAVSKIIVQTLAKLDMRFPKPKVDVKQITIE